MPHLLILLPAVALAQDTKFVPLVGIPFVDTSSGLTLGSYINSLYLAAISIAAFLAVVKIIFAGVQYMLSEVVTDKAQAKKSIYGAIIGLLIVLGAFLILNTINPNLTNLTNLDGPTLQTEGGGTNFEFVRNTIPEPENRAGDSYQRCSYFDSLDECEDVCTSRQGEIITRNSQTGNSQTVCKFRKTLPGDKQVTNTVTLNEDLTYSSDEIRFIQQDLGDDLEFPIRNILRQNLEEERATCSGTSYVLEQRTATGMADSLHLVCVK